MIRQPNSEMRACHAGGFTLVEVLVALVIVAIGMAAVLGAMSSAADSTAYLRDRTLAQWVGLNRITEVRLTGRVPSEGKSEGTSEMGGREWRWEQEVTEFDIPGIMRIDVKVQPAELPESERKVWLATVTGVMGDAVGRPVTPQSPWDELGTGGPGGPPGRDPNPDPKTPPNDPPEDPLTPDEEMPTRPPPTEGEAGE